MFKETVVTQLGFDATTGLATSIVSSEKKNLLSGALAHITSTFSQDKVVTGLGRTVGAAATHYGVMQLTRKKHVGDYAINPLKPAV